MAQSSQRDLQKKSSLAPGKTPSQAMAPRPFAPQADVAAPDVQAPDLAAPDTPGLDSAPAFPKLNFQVRTAVGSPPPLQPKLTIGAPNDKYEQEADRVAAQVVQQIHSPAANLPAENRTYQAQSVQRQAGPEQPVLKMKSTLQRETLPDKEDELQMKPLTEQIQRMELPDDDELQMKPFLQRQGSGAVAASNDLETAIQHSRGSGQPLADSIREPMEQAFGGIDFRGVKVHTDKRSDLLNQSIQVRAFTTGQDVFFRQGAYEPESRGGQELLTHELPHVVQQKGTAMSTHPFCKSKGSRPERKASRDLGAEEEVLLHNGKRRATSIVESGRDKVRECAPNAALQRAISPSNKYQLTSQAEAEVKKLDDEIGTAESNAKSELNTAIKALKVGGQSTKVTNHQARYLASPDAKSWGYCVEEQLSKEARKLKWDCQKKLKESRPDYHKQWGGHQGLFVDLTSPKEAKAGGQHITTKLETANIQQGSAEAADITHSGQGPHMVKGGGKIKHMQWTPKNVTKQHLDVWDLVRDKERDEGEYNEEVQAGIRSALKAVNQTRVPSSATYFYQWDQKKRDKFCNGYEEGAKEQSTDDDETSVMDYEEEEEDPTYPSTPPESYMASQEDYVPSDEEDYDDD